LPTLLRKNALKKKNSYFSNRLPVPIQRTGTNNSFSQAYNINFK
jgi:hypothetical protein